MRMLNLVYGRLLLVAYAAAGSPCFDMKHEGKHVRDGGGWGGVLIFRRMP